MKKNLWRSTRDQSTGKCALKNAISCVELNPRRPQEGIGPRRWRSNETLMDKTNRWLEAQQGLSAWDEEEGDEVMSDCESLFSLDSLSSAYATVLAERLKREEEGDSEDSQMSEDSLTVKNDSDKSADQKFHGSPLVGRPRADSTEVNWSQRPNSPCQEAAGDKISAENLQTNPGYPSSSVWEPEHQQAPDPGSSTCAADSPRVLRTCLSVQKKETFTNTVSGSSGAANVSNCSSTSLATVLHGSHMKSPPDNPLTGTACPEGQSEGLLDLLASQDKHGLTDVELVIDPGASRSPVAKLSTSCCQHGEISCPFAACSHSARVEGHCCQHDASSNISKNNQKTEPAGDGAPSSAWDQQPNGGESGGERSGAAQQELVRSDCKNSRKRNKEQQDVFTGSLKMLRRSSGAEPSASCNATVGSQGEIWLGRDSNGKMSAGEEHQLLPVFGPNCSKQESKECQSGTSTRNSIVIEGAVGETSPHMSKSAAICSAIDLRISEVANEHVRLSFAGSEDEQKEASRSLKASSSAAGKIVTESQFRDESRGPVPEPLESKQSCALQYPQSAQDFLDVQMDLNFIKTFQYDLISRKESCGLISQMFTDSNVKSFDLCEPAAVKDTLSQRTTQLVPQSPALPPAREVGCSSKEAAGSGFSKQDVPLPILHSLKCLDHHLTSDGENLLSKETRTETAVDRNFLATHKNKTGKKLKPPLVVQKCVVNVRYSDKCRSCAAKASKESATCPSEASTAADSEKNHGRSLKSEQKTTQGGSFNQSVTSSGRTQHIVAAASRKVKRLRRSKVPTGLASSPESSLKSSDEDEEDPQSSGVHHSRPQPRCLSPTSERSRELEFTPGRKSTSDIFPKVVESRSEAKTLKESFDKVVRDSNVGEKLTAEENPSQQLRDASMRFACSDINPFAHQWQDVNPDKSAHKSEPFGSAADLSRKSLPLIAGGARLARCCSVDDGLNGRDSPPFNSHLSTLAAKRGLCSTLSSVEGRTPPLGGSGRVDEIMFVYSTKQGAVTQRRRSCESGTQTPAKQRERHGRSCTDGAVVAQRSDGRSLRESQTWASMESMSAHISKLIDSTSDLLDDVQDLRTGGGGRAKRRNADPSTATKRDGSTQTAVDVSVQTERSSTPPCPSQHNVNLVVRVVADQSAHGVPIAAQRPIRSASSRGSRRGAFMDRASSPILTVRSGSKPKEQRSHPLQQRGGNSFTSTPNHQSEGSTSHPDGEGPSDGSSIFDSSRAFNTQSISPNLRPSDDRKQQVVGRRSLDTCRLSPSFSAVAADLLHQDGTTSPVPSECNTDTLVNAKPVGAESEDRHVVPEDLPLHNKFNNWSGIAARSSAASPRGGAECSEAEESSSAGPVGRSRAGEIERLRRERERLLATVGLGGNSTLLSVELKEAKLHYGLGETDTLLKMLSVTPSCREEEPKDATTKQQLYER